MATRTACLGLLLAALTALAAHAAVAQCPSAPSQARNPEVRVEVLEPNLHYRHDLDLVGLARVGNTFELAPRGGVVLGLTARSDEVRLQLRPLSLQLPDGRLCVWVADVQVTVGEPEMDVYVASNYPVGSCEYKVVLQHEKQHVAINQAVVKAYGPRIGTALRNAVHRMFPMVMARREELDQLPQRMLRAIEPAAHGMQAELQARNGEIDTPENYRRTRELCSNWFPPGTKLPQRR